MGELVNRPSLAGIGDSSRRRAAISTPGRLLAHVTGTPDKKIHGIAKINSHLIGETTERTVRCRLAGGSSMTPVQVVSDPFAFSKKAKAGDSVCGMGASASEYIFIENRQRRKA